ncbi:MAG TPA: hypothetical protein PK299_07650 [Anaerolineales bacterium]|nr:hypothetical protein [Anaerolineales bacterium]
MRLTTFSILISLGIVFALKLFSNTNAEIIPVTGHLISVSESGNTPPIVPTVLPPANEPEITIPKTYEPKKLDSSIDYSLNQSETASPSAEPNNNSDLLSFVEDAKIGSPELTGLYIEDLLSMPIIQQENQQPNWVSGSFNTVTQYYYASLTNTIGILAHNYLAGAYFYEITENQTISIVDGLGNIQSFRVVELKRYQALSPNSPETNLMDLETGEVFEAYEIYIKYYVSQPGETKLVLQTCIENNGNGSWGRYFVVAVPVQ